jgi:magnesium transporter
MIVPFFIGHSKDDAGIMITIFVRGFWMIQIIAILKDNTVLANPTLNQLRSENVNWYWVDFNQPNEDEVVELDRFFHFHPLAIEDCIHKMQRPKLDYYADHTFFVTHSLHSSKEEKRELNFFMGNNYIVTFHNHFSREISEVWERINLVKKIQTWDHYFVLYHLLDKLVDNYFPAVYELEDELNDIENNTFNHSMEELLDQLFETKHSLLKLRYTVVPMKDLLYRALNSHHLEGIHQKKEYFLDIYDHLLKLSEKIEASRELATDIRENYLSINSHQTNKVMRVLTVITTIFMPLTFIAGIYGMNFQYMPELATRYGYFITQFFMIAIGLSMFIWFKKKGWFD